MVLASLLKDHNDGYGQIQRIRSPSGGGPLGIFKEPNCESLHFWAIKHKFSKPRNTKSASAVTSQVQHFFCFKQSRRQFRLEVGGVLFQG